MSEQRFADGASLTQTIDAFQLAVLHLHFIPVVEITIDSKHAVSTRRLRKKDTNAGPVMFSLQNRMVVLDSI